MHKILVLLPFFISMSACKAKAQQETLDYVSYTPPAGWKKETKQSSVIFSTVNNSNRTWCQIAVYKVTAGQGSIDTDFEKEWTELVTPLGVTEKTGLSEVQEIQGWKIKTGTGDFAFNGGKATSTLTTFSGNNVCFSILSNSNSEAFAQAAQDFLNSLQLQAPPAAQPATNNPSGPTVNQPAFKDNYSFNTTNFDDGWTSKVQEDWVEVTKDNIRVLLHYPKNGTIFPADPDPLTRAAWDILVAPRYSNLTNFKTAYINTYNRPYLGSATLTDNATQSQVFVVLFRQTAGWIEVIAPDKATFQQCFQFDPEAIRWDSEPAVLKTLDNMTGRNRFAVAVADIAGTGKWTDHFSSNTFYSNYYTGASEGMSTYSSSQWFEFGSGQSYSWQLIATNSYAGQTKFAQAKGSGTFQLVNNWQIRFSNIENKAKTYNAYFTAVKGGRVLFMNDADYPGSGVFTGFTRN